VSVLGRLRFALAPRTVSVAPWRSRTFMSVLGRLRFALAPRTVSVAPWRSRTDAAHGSRRPRFALAPRTLSVARGFDLVPL
jgi:hypothetical protein